MFDIQIIIWIAVLIGGLYVAYDSFFKKEKEFAIVYIFDMINSVTPFSKPLKAYKKQSSNNKNKTSVSWLYIKGIKKCALIPSNKYIYRNNRGKRTILFAWYGGNNIVPITINEMRFKFKKKFKEDNKISYICDKIDKPELTVVCEELVYSARIMDENRNSQFKKQSFLEKWKPIIVLAMLMLAGLGAIVLTAQNVNKMYQENYAIIHNELVEQRNMYKDLFETITTTRIDDTTRVQKTTNTAKDNG